MGMYLASNGLGDYVFWFYTVQGLVSIVMPALIGIVADRWIPAAVGGQYEAQSAGNVELGVAVLHLYASEGHEVYPLSCPP